MKPQVFDLTKEMRRTNYEDLIFQELRDGQKRIENELKIIRKDIAEIKECLMFNLSPASKIVH